MSRFLCPKCNQNLTDQDPALVRFMGELSGPRFHVQFPIFLPAQLGVYGAVYPDYIHMEPGAEVRFLCPHCKSDLALSGVYRHSWVILEEDNGVKSAVVFNRVFGEHSSFQFDLETHRLKAAYGENIDQYREDFNRELNFFGC